MANEQHISWLQEGVEAWNARRARSEFPPDIANADLSGIALPDADLANANLMGANLMGANLMGANLMGADLAGADLADANLIDATFTNATLDDDARSTIQDCARIAANITKPIDSIETFISEINTIRTCASEQSMRLYFRGEPCIYESLEPSVLRKDNLVKYESGMLNALISQHTAELGSLSALEQWSIAQHYALRTRFLDITRSSNVALFFACEDCTDAHNSTSLVPDGRVYVFAVPETLIKQHDSDTVSIISNFLKLPYGDQQAILEEMGGAPAARNRLIQLVRAEKPCFDGNIDKNDLGRLFIVEPRLSFPRIRVQESAYIVSASPDGISGANIEAYQRCTLIVPSACKTRLWTELSDRGFTREKLFPDLQSSAREINENTLTWPLVVGKATRGNPPCGQRGADRGPVGARPCRET